MSAASSGPRDPGPHDPNPLDPRPGNTGPDGSPGPCAAQPQGDDRHPAAADQGRDPGDQARSRATDPDSRANPDPHPAWRPPRPWNQDPPEHQTATRHRDHTPGPTDHATADRYPGRPKAGLAVASLVTGAIGLVLAVSTWAAWLLVLPGFREAQPYSWIAVVFGLVLGALWFLVLPLGTVSIIVGLLATRRAPALAALARLGMVVALVALAAALGGAVVFVIDASTGAGPPVYPLVSSGG